MIEIHAFSGFQFRSGDQSLTLNNRKSRALLIYLASHPDQPLERALLSELFWPTLPQAVALNNLSKSLGQIRKQFHTTVSDEEPLQTDRHAIRLASGTSWHLDARTFNLLIAKANAKDTAGKAALLAEAVNLYTGEFMAGFSLADCPTFEGWLILQRENHMLQARDAHHWLAAYHLDQNEFSAARDHALGQLALDAWHEEAHRQLMRASYGLGMRSDALAQYAACRKILLSDLGVEPEPSTRTLYEQIKDGTLEAYSTGQSDVGSSTVANLPKQLVPLSGRTHELAAMKADITDPTCRLITIAGPGGVGKTSLALESGWHTVANFKDGAVFVPLEQLQPLSSADLPELLASTISATLALHFDGRESAQQQLYRRLRDKEMLMILDNFEHLLAAPGDSTANTAVTFLTTLLQQAPKIKLVLTSRERLATPAERVLTLEGLPVPDIDASQGEISGNSSVRLFVDQARRIQRDFRLTDGNYAAVGSICILVEGLPLGIELAARWIPHFSPAEIAAAIQENVDFLAAESPQAQQRHQSIRATFSYSWQMLSLGEQQMLACLSIIPGAFSRQAALAITGGNLGELVRLQGKSLLRQERPGHYSLHLLLRQYAAQKLADQPAANISDLKRRFAEYYLVELAQQAAGFNQAWAGEAMKAIARNIENIRGAWQTALDLRCYVLLDMALQPLFHYYRLQGLFYEAQQIFGHAAAVFRSLLQEEAENPALLSLLGRTLLRQARLSGFLAGSEQAIPLLQEGIAQIRRAGMKSDLSRGYAYLGEALLDTGPLPEALSFLDKALDIYRQEGDQDGAALTLEIQAVIASRIGQFAEASQLFQDSISISRRSGNRRLEGRAYHDWGVLLLQQGEFAEASQLLQNSLTIARELELRMPVAFNQSMLARIDRQNDLLAQARTRLVDSLEVIDGSGYTYYLVSALNMLGEILTLTGEIAEAMGPLSRALGYLQGSGTADSAQDTELTLDFLAAAAHYFAATGRPSMAERCCRLILGQVSPESSMAQRLGAFTRYSSDEEIVESNSMGETSLARMIGTIRL